MTTRAEDLIRLSEAAADGMAPEELALLAKEAAEPGDGKVGDLLNEPSRSDPSATTISDLRSAGWVRVWDRRTGEESIVNRNMLTTQLAKRDEQGRLVFTTVRPRDAQGNYLEPFRGKVLCPLHPNHRNRAEADRLGLPTCKKANLVSEYHADLHAQHRHKSEMAALQEIEDNEREQEERLVRQAIIQNAGLAQARPAPAPEPVVEPEPEPEVEPVAEVVEEPVWDAPPPPQPQERPILLECPHCDYKARPNAKRTGKPLSDKQRSRATYRHMEIHHS